MILKRVRQKSTIQKNTFNQISFFQYTVLFSICFCFVPNIRKRYITHIVTNYMCENKHYLSKLCYKIFLKYSRDIFCHYLIQTFNVIKQHDFTVGCKMQRILTIRIDRIETIQPSLTGNRINWTIWKFRSSKPPKLNDKFIQKLFRWVWLGV